MKKAMALLLALTMTLGLLAGCSGPSGSQGDQVALDPDLPTYDSLKVGEDYTDLTAELRVITHRTDLIQENPDARDFTDFIKEFNQLYPNITIKYEGITNYKDRKSVV